MVSHKTHNTLQSMC